MQTRQLMKSVRTLQVLFVCFLLEVFVSETPERRDSQDSGPGTPLFDDDVSQPLEDFPRIFYDGPGWEMQLRQPNKKKITGQRFWKKVFVRIVFQGDSPVVQLFNKDTDKEPFQELPLQGCYSISEIAAQQFDNFGKIFTIKLQYVFYKERPGVRPGQVTKAERITTKLSMFAKYAIDGDYQGVKEFGSDLKKLGLPVEHAPQMSQLFKLGSMNFEDLKQFSMCIEEALFKLNVHRDRALTYKMEEVQVTAVDEIYVEQNSEGHIEKQIARVRLFFLGFLSGMPDIELGLNDLWRQGKEVVGRHDIIPVATEEWIRLEGVEFHSCVQQDQYERTRTIKFKPPDACYIELMRFRVRPPKNRELPLQLKATWVVTGNKVQLRADVLVPGFTSRKLGQIPCEDVAIRFPIPECWIYLFRVEKHFRYGSVKSTHRRTGKIKGIERFLGTVETLQESLIEVTSGQAKYEHHHRAIVWRCPRLPKEGQGELT
jgi:stonin-1/2